MINKYSTLWITSALALLTLSSPSTASTDQILTPSSAVASRSAQATNERLAILRAEREQIQAALMKISSDSNPDSVLRKDRLVGDMKAITAEIARVEKQPAYVTRDGGAPLGAAPQERKQPVSLPSTTTGASHLFSSIGINSETHNANPSPFVFSVQTPKPR